MKRVLAVLALLFASVSAFAQLGYYSAPAPGQNQIWQSGVFYVCAVGTAPATCKASADVTIYSDAAGASPITQTNGVGIPTSGVVTFYAQPGTYKFVYTYTNGPTPSPQTFNVVPNVAGNIALADGYFVVPPSACGASTSGTAGTGNNTIILDGSVAALKVASTNAAPSNNTFTCSITVPSRLTSGKGVIIQDVTFLYSQQGSATGLTMAASPTLQSFTAPVAGTSETASSATLVARGGTLAFTPAVASANLTAISAGQYYSEKVALGTPFTIGTDLLNLQFSITFAQSGSTATLITTPGLIVHYKINNI